MNLNHLFTFGILLLLNSPLKGQVSPENIDNLINESSEKSLEEMNLVGQQEIPLELISLSNNPVDINSIKSEELIHSNLLSIELYNALVEYIKRNGPLVELEELQQVDGYNKKSILTILPFITVHKTSEVINYQQITLRVQRNLSNTNEYYEGSNEKVLLRYKGNISNHISVSFTGEKDAGEKAFTKTRPAFDFNSAHLVYIGSGCIQKIILGDFNVQFGQGLTAWTGLKYGGGTDLSGLYSSGRGIIPYSGTDENRFYRGLAIRLSKKIIETDCWLSYHGIDANKQTDSLTGETYITSFQNSGYHRSYYENINYRSQKEFAYGTTIKYTKNEFQVGLILSGQLFTLPVTNLLNTYNRYSLKGKANLNNGIYYRFTHKNIFLFGETTYNYGNNLGFVNGIIMSLDPKVSFAFLMRYYPKNFLSLKSNSFGVNSDNTNELGKFFGVNLKITKILNYSASLDVFSFPYFKYRVNSSSYGWKLAHQFDFTPVRKFTTKFRYSIRLKQENKTDGLHTLYEIEDKYFHSFRISNRFQINPDWEYDSRFELLTQKKDGTSAGKGTSLSIALFYHPMGKPFSINLSFAVFNCLDFENRIYEYENDVPGSFSVPFYYGIGSRFYSNVNLKLKSSINLSVRYSISLLENSDGEFKSNADLKVQLKLSFR